MEHVIELEDITAAYDRQPVLWDLDLNIPKGSLMGIVGPNGAGKSTLLKIILNLLAPVSGRIRFSIDGETDAKKARRKIAYVPQNGSVNWDFPATVKDIVLMGRYGHIGWCRAPSQGDRLIAEEMIARVGMDSYKDRQINELSGGQQQRVFLARALAQEASVYLLDEPFKGVDMQTEKIIVRILKEMESRGKTILVVHHALRTVPLYFDHVAMINRRLIAAGSVRDVFTEENIEKTFLRRKESDHGTGRFLFFTFMAGLYISNRPGRNDYLRRALRRGGIFYRPPQGSASGGRYFPFVLSGNHAGFSISRRENIGRPFIGRFSVRPCRTVPYPSCPPLYETSF